MNTITNTNTDANTKYKHESNHQHGHERKRKNKQKGNAQTHTTTHTHPHKNISRHTHQRQCENCWSQRYATAGEGTPAVLELQSGMTQVPFTDSVTVPDNCPHTSRAESSPNTRFEVQVEYCSKWRRRATVPLNAFAVAFNPRNIKFPCLTQSAAAHENARDCCRALDTGISVDGAFLQEQSARLCAFPAQSPGAQVAGDCRWLCGLPPGAAWPKSRRYASHSRISPAFISGHQIRYNKWQRDHGAAPAYTNQWRSFSAHFDPL